MTTGLRRLLWSSDDGPPFSVIVRSHQATVRMMVCVVKHRMSQVILNTKVSNSLQNSIRPLYQIAFRSLVIRLGAGVECTTAHRNGNTTTLSDLS